MIIFQLRDRTRSEGGFSLIELLVVILIIGILAALAIPRFLGQRDGANDTKAKNAVRIALTNAETHFAQQQTYSGLTTAQFATLETAITLNDTPLVAGTAGAGVNEIDDFANNGNSNLVKLGAATTANTIMFCAASRSTKIFCASLDANAATQYSSTGKIANASVQATAVLTANNSSQGW